MKLIKIFLLVITLIVTLSSQVMLKGFVPHGIDEGAILYEYKRIYKTLAPSERVDLSPLNVTFFTGNWSSNEKYSLPEWGGGGAIGKNDIVVCVDNKPFLDHSVYQITVHELVHIAINRICQDVAVPRWFHEGLAMILSGEATTRENIVISKALFSGSLMQLKAIDSVNAFGRFRAELAYCQSRQAVLYLIDIYGIGVFQEIIKASNETGSIWKGFEEVLEISERELELLYRNYIMKNHGRFFWLVDFYLIWSGIVLLFLTGYVLTLIRIRKKRKMLEQEEIDEVNGGFAGEEAPRKYL